MYRFTKRAIDILISVCVLIVFSPLLLPIVILLRLSGEGEIFYKQERIGFGRRKFGMFKFATMLKDSPNLPGGEITLRDDPRMTPLGPFLRKSKINELPQIINVLKGEMSIVGPRPLMQVSFDMYSPHVREVVYESKPGVTGLASLVFRDEEGFVWRCNEDPRMFYKSTIYPYKGELEFWYYENKSLWTDIKIIALTIWALVFPQSEAVFKSFPGLPERPDSLQPEKPGRASAH